MKIILVARFILAWLYSLFIGALTASQVLIGLDPKRVWMRMNPLWARGSLAILGIRVHLRGEEHLAQPGVFISNHESLIDIVFMPAVLPPQTKYVAKKSLES